MNDFRAVLVSLPPSRSLSFKEIARLQQEVFFFPNAGRRLPCKLGGVKVPRADLMDFQMRAETGPDFTPDNLL